MHLLIHYNLKRELKSFPDLNVHVLVCYADIKQYWHYFPVNHVLWIVSILCYIIHGDKVSFSVKLQTKCFHKIY